MNSLIKFLASLNVFKNDLDYHFVRASMVIIFLFFGYQKWFDYEAQALIPYISHGPLIFWMHSAFGIRGATYFLGVAEWLFGAFLFAGFWNKKLGILGALGGIGSFVSTITIIPFMPDGWAASAGGFPAMTERVAFLMKDLATAEQARTSQFKAAQFHLQAIHCIGGNLAVVGKQTQVRMLLLLFIKHRQRLAPCHFVVGR
jgi:uncharacterized membrane protein YkgB